MSKIMEIIEKETGGKSYHTYKYSYDTVGIPGIDYDDSPDRIMKWQETAETERHKESVDIKPLADQIRGSSPLLTYFLDGSRHVFKVDDMAYNKQVYPVVAGQIGVGCCKRANKKMSVAKFYRELVLTLPDKANADGWDDKAFFSSKVSKINRIAFDHWSLRKIYEKSIRIAVKNGIKSLSNYLLYNFEDKPEELYYRLKMNVDLCEELDASIYSFPMKYHPINDKEFFSNRDYIGKHWNRKFIRAVQAVLNSTKGKIGKGKEFFEEAFGRDVDEFYKILWMPETFIIYRRIYDEELRIRLAERYTKKTSQDCNLTNEWWDKFQRLSPEKMETAKSIIALNKFNDGEFECTDKEILDVLSYYQIMRKDAEG